MIPCRTTDLDVHDEMPFGMTHPNDTRCPFANDKLPTGWINTCCSFNTETAAENLDRFGHNALARLLKLGLTNEKLPSIVKELRRAADAIDEEYVQPMSSFDDPLRGGITGEVRERFNPRLRPAFEAAIRSIRHAADWYEKVGRLGFNVAVWY